MNITDSAEEKLKVRIKIEKNTPPPPRKTRFISPPAMGMEKTRQVQLAVLQKQMELAEKQMKLADIQRQNEEKHSQVLQKMNNVLSSICLLNFMFFCICLRKSHKPWQVLQQFFNDIRNRS